MRLKYFVTLCVCLMLAACSMQRSTLSYYDSKPQILRVEHDGTYVIRSTGKGRNSMSAMEEAQKKAVYQVVFSGISSLSSSTSPIKPLVLEVNAKDKYADYFNAFFADGGDYEQFVSSNGKRFGSSDFSKNRSQVLCRTDVSVDVAALKARLIEDKIIK